MSNEVILSESPDGELRQGKRRLGGIQHHRGAPSILLKRNKKTGFDIGNI